MLSATMQAGTAFSPSTSESGDTSYLAFFHLLVTCSSPARHLLLICFVKALLVNYNRFGIFGGVFLAFGRILQEDGLTEVMQID